MVNTIDSLFDAAILAKNVLKIKTHEIRENYKNIKECRAKKRCCKKCCCLHGSQGQGLQKICKIPKGRTPRFLSNPKIPKVKIPNIRQIQSGQRVRKSATKG